MRHTRKELMRKVKEKQKISACFVSLVSKGGLVWALSAREPEISFVSRYNAERSESFPATLWTHEDKFPDLTTRYKMWALLFIVFIGLGGW